MPQAASQPVSLTAAWQPLGPSSIDSLTFGNLTGRITALAADPNDTTGNTLYVGTTGGGVWRSTNAAGSLSAATFAPLTDTAATLSIGALAVQPQSNPVLLAGTGDPNDATDSYYGLGILRSTNNGATWTLIPGSHDGVNGNHSFAGLATAGLAFSTTTPTLAVAAFSTSPQSTIVAATNTTSIPGLYYSTDAGATWQMATIYDGATIVQQPQPLGTGQVGNPATSVVWDALRQRFYAAVRNHGYYSSPDGATWTRLLAQPGIALTTANCPVGTNGLGSASCPIFRGVITAQPATGDLYALTVDASNNDLGLWQDLCLAASGTCSTPAPTFATRIDNGALDMTGTTQIAQGSYDLALSAAPAAANGTLLFVGTTDLYRCSMAADASTCTLHNTTNALDGCNAPAAVAPAQHALAAVALATGTPILYLGNDGGLWRSLDGVAETGSVCSATDSTHFDNLNQTFSGSLAQVVSFAQHPTDPNTLLAGLGANGSAATSTVSSQAGWPQLSAGEGGTALLDPATPTNWTLTIGAGVNLAQCTLGSDCTAANFVPPATIGPAQVAYDASLLDPPSLLDPALTSNLITATCRVWRGPAASGATWSTTNAISTALNGSDAPNNNATPCTASSPLIRSLAAGGPSNSSSATQLSGSAVLYAGLSGSLDGGSTLAGHIFVTANANTTPTWTDAALSPVTNDTSDTNLFNPGGFDISSLAVDPHDPTGATVYATVMGFGYPHLYRSTDFGAHWLNLSANLPDAPANSLAVDPNDANTVYIALDTGVYVTQAITTCGPTTNCWSLLGTGLPNAPVISLEAAANLPTSTGQLGMLRAATYGRGIWQTPLLTATSPLVPALTLSATSFTFPATQVSTQSASQTLTVTSSGNAPAILTTLAITGDFTETDTCAGQTLAVGSQCTVTLTFAPSTTGTRTGQLTIYANIPTGQATVALTGTGTTAPTVLFTPTALTFAAIVVNQSDPAQFINIANTGGTTATLQTPIITGADAADFTITGNSCTTTLQPGTACAVAITFTPTTSGTRTATLSLTDSAGTQTASLTGIGNAPATDTLSTNALTFAQQQLNTTSPAQQVTLTNSGGVALTLISPSVSAGDFAIVNSCGNSLAASSTCAISVTFTPTATGPRTATLTIADQFHSQTVTLNGTGIAPPGVSLTPVTLAFSNIGVSLVSQPQTVTLTNNGGQPLSIANTSISPGFTIAKTSCTTTLAPAGACTYTVLFAPTTAGAVTGALTLTTNATPATRSVALTGTGIDFAITPTNATSATITAGSSNVYTMQLSSIASLTGSVALSCTGAPTNSTCTVAPPNAQLGTTIPFTVTVVTDIAVAALAPQAHSNDIYLALLLPLALPLFLRSRTRHTLTLCAALTLASLTALTGCGANRIIPPTGGSGGPGSSNPTPPGTYALIVSGSVDGLTHTVPLTLTVQ
ncbi:choice-of-anchor D domain-containing protein [Granulicella sp. 5B5]|nr:choice-of-anchor D domain-containing protein [Granulicella sp. 5B5]